MKIKAILSLSTFLLCMVFNTMLYAQSDSTQQIVFNQIYSAAQQEYAIDQLIINGISFEKRYGHIGHPYLLKNEFEEGNVVFRGELYTNVLLKYDICTQELIMNYTFNNENLVFYLPKDFIPEFTIYNKQFVKGTYINMEKDRFYQIIGEGSPIKIAYKWYKIKEEIGNEWASFLFSVAMKNSFLHINGNWVRYRGNNSFARIFPKQYRKPIKKYMRSSKINVKYGSDEEMELLLNYCNSLNNIETSETTTHYE